MGETPFVPMEVTAVCGTTRWLILINYWVFEYRLSYPALELPGVMPARPRTCIRARAALRTCSAVARAINRRACKPALGGGPQKRAHTHGHFFKPRRLPKASFRRCPWPDPLEGSLQWALGARHDRPSPIGSSEALRAAAKIGRHSTAHDR